MQGSNRKEDSVWIDTGRAAEYIKMMDVALDEGISILDENLNYLFINAATYEALNITPDQIKPGDNLKKIHQLMIDNGLLNDEIIQKNNLSSEEQELRGKSSRFTKIMEFADGRTMKLTRTHLENGHTVSVFSDISELVEKEKLLQNSLILGRSGYWIYDVQSKTTSLSRSLHQYFSDEDIKKIQSNGINVVAHPEDKKTLPKAIAEAAKSNDRFNIVVRTYDRFKRLRWNQLNGEILRDAEKKPVKIRTFVKDITAEHDQAAALELAKDQALAASHAKSEFLANMSHEIRTPMNGILGMAELLANSNIDDANKEHVSVIYKSANALLTIINDILDFSKIEAGAMELDPTPFNLRELVNDVTSLMIQPAQAKGLELIVNYDTDQHSHFIADSVRVRQIITNLLNNAIKFTEHGHILIDVRVQGERTDNKVVQIKVKDTGIGIEPDKLSSIFENFTQADNSTTRLYGGTGLGLSICKKLIEMMNGRITVESEFGDGSTFTVTVPLPVDHDAVPQAYDNSTLINKRVLIVDDIALNCSVLKRRLAKWQMDPVAVEDAVDALTLIKKEYKAGRKFDLIISDYLMPGMNGLEFSRLIASSPSLPDIPVIMLSSCDQPISSEELKSINVPKFLMKPARETTLYDAIVKVMSASSSPEKTPEPVTPKPKKVEPVISKKTSILVAEDFHLNQDVIRLMLADSDFEPSFVSNGQEAIDQYCAHPDRFPVILMDISMPKVDGYEAAKAIRAFEKEHNLAHAPIIALTGHALKHDRENCLAAGMDDYLSKPVRQENLLAKLSEWSQVESGKSSDIKKMGLAG